MHSEARTESLRQTEKWALITFVASMPVIYGLFWYVGIWDDALESFTKKDREAARAAARAKVEARWGAEAVAKASPLPPPPSESELPET